jgi:hypothetical protein
LKYWLTIILTTSGTVAIFLTFLSASRAFTISSVIETIIFCIAIYSFTGVLYVTYGSMTTATLSLGVDVHRFVAVRHGSWFEFETLDTGLRIPVEPQVYGFGGSRKDWIEPVQRFVASLEERGLKLRYCGTFVGDYNQVLSRGASSPTLP